ncbi:SDR family oxidoreductase [Monashia sp. NPDC004114]
MTSRILLTGGTGTLGKQVAPLLRAAGADLRILSRTRRGTVDGVEYVVGDLTTGVGAESAVAGVDTIVHCAGTQQGDEVKTANLVRAVRATAGASLPHLVFISVVGAERVPVVSRVDRMMFAYFASKRAAEQVVEQSGLPWTTLRATQFHDLALLTLQGLAKSPLMPYFSGTRFQPVDTGEVAARLAALACAAPAGLVDEMGGPTVYEMKDLARSYLAATGKRRLLVPLRAGGQAGRAIRAGANLTPAHAVGRRTWEDFLAERVGHHAAPSDGTSAQRSPA